MLLFSPSELNDIDSEDETYNKSEYENDEAQMSDLDIKPGKSFFTRLHSTFLIIFFFWTLLMESSFRPI